MSITLDTLTAARDMERAGLQQGAAESVAEAVRAGQGELATRADLDALRTAAKTDMDALRGDVATLRWMIVIHPPISLATLAVVPTMAFRA